MGATESNLLDQPESESEADDTLIQQAERHSHSQSQRQRPRLSSTTTKPFLKHKGWILGLPSSGKRTLLKRLEGKDPFSSISTEEETKRINQVRVPFHSTSILWDRLLLHVSIPDHTYNGIEADFAVVLIHPQHDPTLVRTYLATILSSLLQQRTGPVALSVLLNFRDLQSETHPLIQEVDLQDLVDKMLNHNPHRHQVHVQIGTTSLKNCYGLLTLHQFIYRSYLLKKEFEWKEQLKICQQQIHDTNTAPTITYNDFLQHINHSKGAISPSNLTLYDNGDNFIANEKPVATGPRSLGLLPHPQGQKILPIGIDPTKSLEAFFADSDEDEPVANTTLKKGITRDNNCDNDDDDDDDDGFFYNEVGQQMSVLQETSSSDWSTPATIIPIPIPIMMVEGKSIPDKIISAPEPKTVIPPNTHQVAPVLTTAKHDIVECDAILHQNIAKNNVQLLEEVPPKSPFISVMNISDPKTMLEEDVSENKNNRKKDDWNHESHDVIVNEPLLEEMETEPSSAHRSYLESSTQGQGLNLEPSPTSCQPMNFDNDDCGGSDIDDDRVVKETCEKQSVVANTTVEGVTPFVNGETNSDVMELEVDGIDQSPELQEQLGTDEDDDDDVIGTDRVVNVAKLEHLIMAKPFHVDNCDNDNVIIDNGVSNPETRTVETQAPKEEVRICISEPRSGLSQAALAAIFAAEEQGRRMLVEGEVKLMKKEKKKKSKEEKDKKERKKKKEVKRAVMSSTGNARGIHQQAVEDSDSDW